MAGYFCHRIAGMYLANLLGTLVTMILGIVKGSMVSNNLLQIVTSNHIWANIIVVGILAPIIEEYVFRKLLIDRTIKYGEGIAVLTSALMFALFHGNLNQFAYAFVLGGCLRVCLCQDGRYPIYPRDAYVDQLYGIGVDPRVVSDFRSGGLGEPDLIRQCRLYDDDGWFVSEYGWPADF